MHEMELKMKMVTKILGLASDKVSVDCAITTKSVDDAYYNLTEASHALEYMVQEGVNYVRTDYSGFELEVEEIKAFIAEEDEAAVQCWIRTNGVVELIVLTNENMKQAYEQVDETVKIFEANA